MHTMLELLKPTRPIETVEAEDRERRRLSARQLRAELRERERQERAIMEIAWSRLC
ncbi:hypothetical protein [Nocardiopsis composta]|uniref:Uncharacterized protein n=1 Tax=Nocardiopsis composta TaxID=157465 RepID=A0A7W8QQP4_9ACTN|nr:hypothetical protein [Nocardiopsis composta]MBB5434822.1 hypothetical protein [Nocardiopsis composta]